MLGEVFPEATDQLVVNQRVLGRRLGGRVPRGASEDAIRFDHRNAKTLLREQICRRNARDATADDGDIRVQILVQPGITGFGHRRNPIRGGSFLKICSFIHKFTLRSFLLILRKNPKDIQKTVCVCGLAWYANHAALQARPALISKAGRHNHVEIL